MVDMFGAGQLCATAGFAAAAKSHAAKLSHCSDSQVSRMPPGPHPASPWAVTSEHGTCQSHERGQTMGQAGVTHH